MKGIVEERAVEPGEYIISHQSTVRGAAKEFGISKSVVHMEGQYRMYDLGGQMAKGGGARWRASVLFMMRISCGKNVASKHKARTASPPMETQICHEEVGKYIVILGKVFYN